MDSWTRDEPDYAEILQAMRLQDGGLVEIYVFGTQYADWTRAIESLRRRGFTPKLVELETGEQVDLTPDLFGNVGEVKYRLTLCLEGQVWTSNLFCAEYIDLQGNPRDIKSIGDIENTIRLMSCLNSATAKRVVFVAETLSPETIRPYISIN